MPQCSNSLPHHHLNLFLSYAIILIEQGSRLCQRESGWLDYQLIHLWFLLADIGAWMMAGQFTDSSAWF